jgi:hypothetical protein
MNLEEELAQIQARLGAVRQELVTKYASMGVDCAWIADANLSLLQKYVKEYNTKEKA